MYKLVSVKLIIKDIKRSHECLTGRIPQIALYLVCNVRRIIVIPSDVAQVIYNLLLVVAILSLYVVILNTPVVLEVRPINLFKA